MQYHTGTVTVTNGSATVTGTGTAWSTTVFPEALFAIPNVAGLYRVQSVTSDTVLVLDAAWQGPTLTGKTYWITVDFTPIHNYPIPQPADLEAIKVLSEALTMIDRDIGGVISGTYSAKSVNLNTPPASPANGDTYVVGTAPTGVWVGYNNNVAVWRNGSWAMFPPSDGAFLKIVDLDAFYFYEAASSAWVLNPLTAGSFLSDTGGALTGALELINGSAATPALSFASDLSSGLYASSASNYGLSVGGVAAMRFQKDATTGKVTVTLPGDFLNINTNFLTLNAAVAGTPTLNASIVVNRGTLPIAFIEWDETSQLWRVGLDGSLQALATREDAPIASAIAYWDDMSKRFATSSVVSVTGTGLELGTLSFSGTNPVISPSTATTNITLQGGINGTTDGAQLIVHSTGDASNTGGIDLVAAATGDRILNFTGFSAININGVPLTSGSSDAATLGGHAASYFSIPSDTRAWSQITATPTTLAGYGIADAEGILTQLKTVAGPGSGLDADTVGGKTATYLSSYTNLTNVPTLFATDWSMITNIPSSFTPSYHVHAIADVTGLQAALDSKQATIGYTPANQAGDTFTGPVYLSGDPADPLQAATKGYVDAALTGQTGTLDYLYVNESGDVMTGPLILSGDPVDAMQAVTKHYVDRLMQAVSMSGVSGGSGGTIYIPSTYVPGTPQPGSTILLHKFAVPASAPADFIGSQIGATVAPDADFVLTIQQANSGAPNTWENIGTVTLPAGSLTPLWATTGDQAFNFGVGDEIRVLTPATTDASIKDVHVTMLLTRISTNSLLGYAYLETQATADLTDIPADSGGGGGTTPQEQDLQGFIVTTTRAGANMTGGTPVTYASYGAKFDGSTVIANQMLNAPTGPIVSASFWMYFTDVFVNNYPALWVSDPLNSAKALQKFSVDSYNSYDRDTGILLQNPQGYDIVRCVAGDYPLDPHFNPGRWYHVLFSANTNTGTSPSAQFAIYIDGVAVANANYLFTSSTGFDNMMGGLPFYIGGDTFSGDFFQGYLADFWFDTSQSLLDPTTGLIPDATIALFRDPTTGLPVNLGNDGSLPTGISPTIFLKCEDPTIYTGSADIRDSFLLNRGTGGDFSYVSGQLAYAPTTPSDDIVFGGAMIPTVGGVHFDGSSGIYCMDPTIPNSRTFTLSCWVRLPTTITLFGQNLFQSAGQYTDPVTGTVTPFQNGGATVNAAYDRPSFDLQYGIPEAGYTQAGGVGIDVSTWCHVAMSADLDAGWQSVFINGILASSSMQTSTWGIVSDILWNNTPMAIGYSGDSLLNPGFPDQHMNGDIAEFWFSSQALLPPESVIGHENLVYFINNGLPALMNSDGSISANGGVTPEIYLSHVPGADTSDFFANKGSAGTFTGFGTLTESTTRPRVGK